MRKVTTIKGENMFRKKRKMQLESELLAIASEKYYNTILKVTVVDKYHCIVSIEKEPLKSTLEIYLPIALLKTN
jgi:hypothetical protein